MRNLDDDADRIARLNQIKAVCLDGDPENEIEHFAACPVCGQIFDMRHLGEAFHHYRPKHEPRARS